MDSTLPIGSAAAILAAFIWAVASGTYSRAALSHPPFVVNATRTLVCVMVLSAISAIRPGGFSGFSSVTASHFNWMILAAFSSYSFGDALFLKASHHIGISNALTIGSSYPVISAIVGVLWFREQMSLALGFGIVLVVLGMGCVLRSPRSSVPEGEREGLSAKGLCYAAGATCCWAFLTVATQRAAFQIDGVVATILKASIGFFLCILVGFIMERSVRYPLLPRVEFRSIFPICAIEMGIGSLCYTYAFQFAPLAVAATLCSIHPIFSLIIAVRAGQERLSLRKIIGMILVVSGIGSVVSS